MARESFPPDTPAPRPRRADRRTFLAQPLPRFLRPRRRLRSGIVEVLFVLAGLMLGLLLPQAALGPTVSSTRVSQLLATVGFGLVGLVSIIFSLLFLVVQWVYGTYSPRLNLFRDDPIVWRTFGYTVGVFVFTITAALVIGDRPTVSLVVPACAMLMVLAALALIRHLQLKAFTSIQLAPTLSTLAARGLAVLDALYREPFGGDLSASTPLPASHRTVRWPHGPTTLQQLDIALLCTVAAQAGGAVTLRIGVGEVLQTGAPVADIHGGDLPDSHVLRAIVAGNDRTFDQDPLFAFRLLADIALRALSAAINDPATGVQCLDAILGLLRPLAARDLAVAEVTDDAGTVRVVLALPSWEDFVRIGLDDIIVAAAGSPMVLQRTRAQLAGLRDAAPPERRNTLALRLRMVEEQLAGRYPLIWQATTGHDRSTDTGASVAESAEW
jgi:uncharacterized membrane protein